MECGSCAEPRSRRPSALASGSGGAEGGEETTPGAHSVLVVYARHRCESESEFFRTAGADAVLEWRFDSGRAEATDPGGISPIATGGSANPRGEGETERAIEGRAQGGGFGEGAPAAAIDGNRDGLELAICDGAIWLATVSQSAGSGGRRGADADTLR